MSTVNGDMDPTKPQRVEGDSEPLEQLGYLLPVPDGPSRKYIEQTNEIAIDFLQLQQTSPDQALREIPNYLGQMKDIERDPSILSRLTPHQFGLIVNIASRGYDPSNDPIRGHFLFAKIDEHFAGKSTVNIGSLTAQIRKPQLLRDLVAQRSAVNWPHTNRYILDASGETTEWQDVEKLVVDVQQNNPLMYALAIPRASVDPAIRGRFRDEYPELAQQGIDIIAAGLFSRGAHDELTREENPEVADRYNDWETSIHEALSAYGDDYQPDILYAITEANWHIYDDAKFNSPTMTKKLLGTSFSLDDNGRLVRDTQKITDF